MDETIKSTSDGAIPPTSNPTLKSNLVFNVSPEGSLGLLALGYQGLIAWRKAKSEETLNSDQNTVSAANE